MSAGIIYKAISGFYYVQIDNETIVCKARGRFRLLNITPLVGDIAEIARTGEDTGVLETILPRKNTFIRPPIANIDQLIVIASAVTPVTDPFLIDRMTAIAALNDCDCIICINKTDLNKADVLYDIYSRTGLTTIRTSAETGEGLQQLLDVMKDKLSAMTGNSGVGKSSIINKLEPDFKLNVGEVSEKLGRGRHTTRHIELFRLKNGAVVADTPGFSSFDTELMKLTDNTVLQNVFVEFQPFIGKCQFNDCAHIKEPNCAVLDAVKQGIIPISRHESYVRLHGQIANMNEWDKPTSSK